MLLNDQPLSHQNTPHISFETWTLGKFPSLKKSSFLLQSRHHLTTQSQIGQSICFEEVEKYPNSRIAAFHDFNAGFDRPIDGGNNSNPLAWPYWEEWQLLIQAETTKQLIREELSLHREDQRWNSGLKKGFHHHI